MFPFNHIFFKPFKSQFSSLFSFVFLNLLIMLSTLLSANIAHCLNISFAWDENTEPDLAGYYIYYKNGDSGAPYNGTGADEGDSPIKIPLASLNDPTNPKYTLQGLSAAGTFYFVATSYDTADNESHYSNELCFGDTCVVSNQGTGESGGGGCFIATTAFGSKFEKQVHLLRRFRDLYLMPHSIGRAFVRVYYRYSPSMADFIAKHDILRTVVRAILLPVVGVSWIALKIGPLSAVALMFIFISCFVRLVWYRRRYKE
jgi:hypothetical protein